MKFSLKIPAFWIVSLIIFVGSSCTPVQEKQEGKIESQIVESSVDLTAAEVLLMKAYEAHGGDKYNSANYEFVFRDKKYTFINDEDKFTYTVSFQKDGKDVVRILKDWNLEVTVNGELQDLTEKEIKGYSNGLNSVIYFATLPHKLLDPAVVLKIEGEASIQGVDYDMLSVKFKQAGGGEDFEDEYNYWINKDTQLIDYLAYNYKVNGGGVRFRSAQNRRVVDGISFQDYINYKAEVGTPLMDLGKLYEKGVLVKLSEIITEKVISIKR